MKQKTYSRVAAIAMLMTLLGITGCGNTEDVTFDATPKGSIYGEWRLEGWNEQGTWFEVDTNYVSHRHLSIEIPKEGYVTAYSMVNEIFVGLLTLNGNKMLFYDGGGSTKVYCSFEENLFFEDHICDIKSYQLEGNQLKLFYSDIDYFVFTSDFDDSETSLYAWKDLEADPYMGEVTSISNDEVEVKIVHHPSSTFGYTRNYPPTVNNLCRIAAADLSGLSFSVGDRIAFQIVQFRRLKTDGDRLYECKVKPSGGSVVGEETDA